MGRYAFLLYSGCLPFNVRYVEYSYRSKQLVLVSLSGKKCPLGIKVPEAMSLAIESAKTVYFCKV